MIVGRETAKCAGTTSRPYFRVSPKHACFVQNRHLFSADICSSSGNSTQVVSLAFLAHFMHLTLLDAKVAPDSSGVSLAMSTLAPVLGFCDLRIRLVEFCKL